eukprot:m.69163 g.69163  ORF g.69163 m.69163 type:complete len:162 (-) comp19960_c0_seq2:24-509(-)
MLAGGPKMIRALLELGADPNQKIFQPVNPSRKLPILDSLVLDPPARPFSPQFLPFEWLCNFSRYDFRSIAALLVDFDSEVELAKCPARHRFFLEDYQKQHVLWWSPQNHKLFRRTRNVNLVIKTLLLACRRKASLGLPMEMVEAILQFLKRSDFVRLERKR